MPATDLRPDLDRRYYPGISILRAVAAGLVLLQHAAFLAGQAASVNDFPNLRFSSGELGVMMFFCISGFVIGLQRTSNPGRFFARRFLRIYPPYWAACAISVLLSALLLDGQAQVGPASLLLLPGVPLNNSLHIPYWTLVFEIVFYVLAGVGFSARLSDRAIAISCWAWILLVQLAAGHFGDAGFAKAPGFLILLAPYVQLFALGMLASIALDRLDQLPDWPFCAAAVTGFTIVASFPLPFPLIVLLWGISLTSIVVLSLRIRRTWPVFDMLGDASYGLYLIHLPILFALAAIFAGTTLPASYLMPIFFLIPGGLGVLFGALEFRIYRHVAARLIGTLRPRHTAETVARD